jgi:2-C-methyl-D-erythritol 4-phosphate cytidylyltransferase
LTVWAVLAAAGQGERLGLDRPKAFAPLAGRPLLAESLERLDASAWIDAVVVAAPAGWEEPVILLAEEIGAGKVVEVVGGGPTRSASVRAAVDAVPEAAVVILVHDAARPLVTDDVVARLLGALGAGWDGAVPGLPIADTVKRVHAGRVEETIEREGLVVAQTPQAFPADRLREALAADLPEATDCSSLVEARGGRITVVPGDHRLLKVTAQADLELVERLLAAERS